MEIRTRLIQLHRLKIGPEVLRMYQTDLYDLELLALAEDELTHKEEAKDGDGSEMAAKRRR